MEHSEQFTALCPLCEKSHTYKLQVESNLVFLRIGKNTDVHKKREREFTLLLTCPVKNETFEATIKLEETLSLRINKVKVTEEAQNGR